MEPRPCLFCMTVFVPVGHGNSQTCSDECRRNYRRVTGGYRGKARATKRGVAYEPISRTAVFNRDGWRCRYCHRPTPRDLLGTYDDRAPELDHRVPMAMGGGHVMANVQLACRRCNRLKGQAPRFFVLRAES